MSEAEDILSGPGPDKQEWVTMYCARGCVLNDNGEVRNLAPGDEFEAPVTRAERNVFPVRWWEITNHGFRDKDHAAAVAEAFTARVTASGGGERSDALSKRIEELEAQIAELTETLGKGK